MNTKKLLSAAAAVAVMTSGAMAFDTDGNGDLFKIGDPEKSSTYVAGSYTYENNATLRRNLVADTNLIIGVAGRKGDALIYPAFFSKGGWSSEFTVINNSNNAMIAKVVLYSAISSKELRDFNIYLSANDVFRATLKDGRIVSTDGSTIISANQTDNGVGNQNTTTRYTDNATFASEKTPFDISLPEDKGYIAVYGMAEVQSTNEVGSTDPENKSAKYHKQHLQLWKDYRHLVDVCRSTANTTWRNTITDGIYSNGIYAPDINISSCGVDMASTLINSKTKKADYTVTFQSPRPNLAGAIVLKGGDSHGTRAMKLNAVPLLNFTDDNVNNADQVLLWTEGEFAALADRNIDNNGSNYAKYNETLVQNDAASFNRGKYIFEFGNSKEDQVIVTQPLKRTLIQLDTINIASKTANSAQVETGRDALTNLWNGITFTPANFIKEDGYGSFILSANVYNDDEDKHTANADSFIVSPATISTSGAPGEVSIITSFLKDAGYAKGYAVLPINVPAIVTQMSATEVNGNVETNWIYSTID